MKERPILFSCSMVRAILEGRKTQTRRIAKLVSEIADKHEGVRVTSKDAQVYISRRAMHTPSVREQFIVDCPYGQPGDRLYVREHYRLQSILNDIPAGIIAGSKDAIRYEADGQIIGEPIDDDYGRLRVGRFMPRKMSRITLEITNVRVERLQDISVEDCIAEGVGEPRCDCGEMCPANRSGYIADYANLWMTINGDGSWAANPWVWVVEFTKLSADQPIAALTTEAE